MSATLDGIELDAEQDLRWALTTGATPYVGTFETSIGAAAALMGRAGLRQSVLRFSPAGVALPVEIKGLTIIGVKPASHPALRLVVVADPRWAWRFKHIYRRWNVRATTGNTVRVGDLDAPLAVKQLEPTEIYRRWSLDGEKGMTHLRALFDVLTELEGLSGFVDETGQAVGQAGPQVGDGLVEDELLNDSGENAVRRLTARLGAIDVHCNPEGKICVRNRLDDGERVLVGLPALGLIGTKERGESFALASLAGEPLYVEQDRRWERPVSYAVLYDRELEIRIDVAADGSAATETVDEDDPPIRGRNVLQVPDESITLADGTVALQGTWVPIEDYVTAKDGTWLAGHPPEGQPPQLTLDLIRRLFLCPGAFDAYTHPSVDAGGRNRRALNAIMSNYRVTFQIEKTWRDRLAWIRPHLVSIVNPSRSTLADSPVFCDYATWLTWRSSYAEAARGNKATFQGFVENHYAAGSEDASVLDATVGSLKRAPALVRIVDADAGVFSLVFKTDATGEQEMVAPSAIDPDSIPSSDPTERRIFTQWAAFKESHEISIIVTVGMGSPNDNRALHTVEVDPSDPEIARRIGRTSVGECRGPVKMLRVDSSQGIAARFAWLDSNERSIRALFRGKPLGAGEAELVPALINGDDLKAVAQAVVTADLAGLLDHVEGSHGVDMRGDLTPKGTASIEHRLAPGESGGAITTVVCPPDPPRVDVAAFMPDGVRKRVLAQLGAQPAGGGT